MNINSKDTRLFVLGTFRDVNARRKLRPIVQACQLNDLFSEVQALEYASGSEGSELLDCGTELREITRYFSDASFCLKTFCRGLMRVVVRCWGFRDTDVVRVECEHILKRAGLVPKLKGLMRAVCGIDSFETLWSLLRLSHSDVLLVWGFHGSVYQILRARCELEGVTLIHANWGDLQGTFSLDTNGVYWGSSVRKRHDEFRKLPVDKQLLDESSAILEGWTGQKMTDRIFSHSFSKADSGIRENQPVIYVNGVDSLDSCLAPRNTKASHEYSPYFASNRDVIETVVAAADKNGWKVIYKDHPNVTVRGDKAAVRENLWGQSLSLPGNAEIHSVLTACDVVVTLPSKTTLLALAHGKPVLQLGPNTISSDDLKFGLFEAKSRDIEAVLKCILSNQEKAVVDRDGLICFVARLKHYYLFDFEGGRETCDEIADFLNAVRNKRQPLFKNTHNERERSGVNGA